MSLEQALLDNTRALQEVAALLSLIQTPQTLVDAAAAAPVEVPASIRKDKPAKAEKAEQAPAAQQPEAQPEPQTQGPAEVAQLDYDLNVKPLIIELTRKDRDAAVSILSGFGAKTGKDLKPQQYADALAQLQAALES